MLFIYTAPNLDPKLEPKMEPKLEPKPDPGHQFWEPKLGPKVEPKLEPKLGPELHQNGSRKTLKQPRRALPKNAPSKVSRHKNDFAKGPALSGMLLAVMGFFALMAQWRMLRRWRYRNAHIPDSTSASTPRAISALCHTAWHRTGTRECNYM